MQPEVIKNTILFVKKELQNAEGGHDWFHIERVWKNAKLIAKSENVNLLILRIDLATPLRYPYQIDDNNWVDNPFKKALKGDLNLNIGIGYPF